MDASVAIFEDHGHELISLQDALQAGVTDLEKLPIAPCESTTLFSDHASVDSMFTGNDQACIPAQGSEVVEYVNPARDHENGQFDVFEGECEYRRI